jgi:hypothetical protein
MKSAEEILFDIMTENNFTYVSFPSFVENESSVDVYDIACKAVEYAMEQYHNEGLRDELIKYGVWYLKALNEGRINGSDDEIINAYLKQKGLPL